jgi:hypothetical protein
MGRRFDPRKDQSRAARVSAEPEMCFTPWLPNFETRAEASSAPRIARLAQIIRRGRPATIISS